THNATDVVVRVGGDLPVTRKREVTLHELVHAVDSAVETGLEESQVGRLSRGLFALCADNPAYMLALLFPEAAARLDALDEDPHALVQVPNPRGGYTLISTRTGAVLGNVPDSLPCVPLRVSGGEAYENAPHLRGGAGTLAP